jgi:hypothetical protein
VCPTLLLAELVPVYVCMYVCMDMRVAGTVPVYVSMYICMYVRGVACVLAELVPVYS